jgi:hypothetical protein
LKSVFQHGFSEAAHSGASPNRASSALRRPRQKFLRVLRADVRGASPGLELITTLGDAEAELVQELLGARLK